MKITESKLRRIIREELDGEESKIAIAVFGDMNKGPAYMIAYKVDKLDMLLRGDYAFLDGKYDYSNGVIAGVSFEKGKHPQFGECNGSWHAINSASTEKGWGMRVYLAALQALRIIASDRFSVRPSAEGVWKKLARYGFVEQETFDNISNPMTPPTRDDCRVLSNRDLALNSSWKITGEIPSDVKELIDTGILHLAALKEKGLLPKACDILRNGFRYVFEKMYV